VNGGGGVDTLVMHIFHANTLLNPKCSFGINVGITMSINIISNTILDDLIVGAWYADPSGKLSAGKSYVVFGKANGSMTKNNDKTIQWTSFNKPKSFTVLLKFDLMVYR
jgi:hypothetical protein